MSLNFPDTTVNNPNTGVPWAQGDTTVVDNITYTFNTDAGPPVTFWWSAATPGGTEGLWQRNGTVLTPFTNNDTVAVTQADGTQNIQLFGTGAAQFAGGDGIATNNTFGVGDGGNINVRRDIATNAAIQVRAGTGAEGVRAAIHGDGSIALGRINNVNVTHQNGAIELNADGQAVFEGTVRTTIETIAANGAWDLDTGNLWQTDANAGSDTIANPTNGQAGLSGLIFTRQEITTWGNNFDFPGGAAPATVPANSVVPFYVVADNNILIGNATENVS